MVVVTYVQETWYLIDDPNSEPDEDFVLLVPLSTKSRRDKYVGRLESLSSYSTSQTFRKYDVCSRLEIHT